MIEIPAPLIDRCAKIELLVLDVDGVLTDGGIIYTEEGTELKKFHVRDGSAIKIWQRQSKRLAFLSGRSSGAVALRASELGVEIVLQGISDKLQGFQQILEQTDKRPEQACFVGDDLPDLPVLANCGFAVGVADACAEVIELAHHVTRLPGGKGAVRETIELILRAQNRWNGAVVGFRNGKL
jgi:YrbI family 3-deoxy-D-manno-octulosonate 8-phosphate phosphatase